MARLESRGGGAGRRAAGGERESGGASVLNVVVAHRLEAAALIEARALRPLAREDSLPFPRYGDGRQLTVAVAGQGRAAMGRACEALAAWDAERNGSRVRGSGRWLNVGIAGHRALPLGTVFLATKVVEGASGETFYPSPHYLSRLTGRNAATGETGRAGERETSSVRETAPDMEASPHGLSQLAGRNADAATLAAGTLVCVDEPETAYPQDAAYDMESSAFCRVAMAAAGADCAQVVKVVSDNPTASVTAVTPARVRAWMEGALAPLLRLIAAMEAELAAQAALFALPGALEERLRHGPCSVTQGHRLRRLGRQLKALGCEDRLARLAADRNLSAGSLIARLEAELAAASSSR